jgi:hypothetical protein
MQAKLKNLRIDGSHAITTYFPSEDWAGTFCPIEKPNRVLDGPFYPLKTERLFLIERFLLCLRVIEYQYDNKKTPSTSLTS